MLPWKWVNNWNYVSCPLTSCSENRTCFLVFIMNMIPVFPVIRFAVSGVEAKNTAVSEVFEVFRSSWGRQSCQFHQIDWKPAVKSKLHDHYCKARTKGTRFLRNCSQLSERGDLVVIHHALLSQTFRKKSGEWLPCHSFLNYLQRLHMHVQHRVQFWKKAFDSFNKFTVRMTIYNCQ